MHATLDLQPQLLLGVCQRYLSKDTKQTQSDRSNSTELEIRRYELRPISDEPAGFLGRHNLLTIEVCPRNDSESQCLRFFTKSAPHEIASRMEYLEDFGVFKKEILVYREVLPELQKDFPDVAAKCYYAANNLLVFENLADSGYRMGAERDGLLDLAHLKCALKTLAAQHAGSLALEARRGHSITEIYPAAIEENAYPLHTAPQNMRLRNFNNAVEVLKAILGKLPKYQQQLPEILTTLPKVMWKIFELSETSTKYTNVFSHGDLWANNIMFQYNKHGRVPQHCRFVDYQLARYAPPMLDLVTILTIPTTKAFRKQYFNELCTEYYRYMREFLQAKGLDIAEHFTESQFFEGIEEFRVCGLIESCLFSHLTVLPTYITQELTGSTDGFSDFFDLKRVELCMRAFREDATYRERLTDMLEDLVDNYVLK